MSIFKKKNKVELHKPILVYNGTSGWSGSDTSKERAVDADGDGTTLKKQNKVLEYLNTRGQMGATWKEIGEEFKWHHGTASGVLSSLHKADIISRLADVRNRCKIYVLPEYVGQAITEKQGRAKICHNCGAAQ